jgi:MFS family permease
MNKKSSNSLWTNTFVRLLILILFIYVGIALVNSTFSVYLVEEFGGSPAQVSLVTSLMTLSATLFRPFAGFLIDRFGRRVTFSLSLAITAVISLAYLLPQSITGLAVLRFLMGIPFAMNTTGNATLRTDLIPEEKRAEGFNITTIAIMLSALVIGPNLGYWILDRFGFGFLFPTAAGSLLIAIGNLFLLKFKDIKTKETKLALNEIIEPRALWFAVILGISFIGWPGVLTYGPLYSQEIGLSFTGYFFLVYGIGLLASQFITRYVQVDGKPEMTGISLVLVIIGHAIIGFIKTRVSFLVGAVFIGAGYGLSFSIFKKMAFDLVEPERRGRCSATLFLIQDIGATIGLYAYGYTSEFFGSFAYSYQMSAIVTILPLILLLVFVAPYYNRNIAGKLPSDIPPVIEKEILR